MRYKVNRWTEVGHYKYTTLISINHQERQFLWFGDGCFTEGGAGTWDGPKTCCLIHPGSLWRPSLTIPNKIGCQIASKNFPSCSCLFLVELISQNTTMTYPWGWWYVASTINPNTKKQVICEKLTAMLDMDDIKKPHSCWSSSENLISKADRSVLVG